jgi:putative thioredoxin
VLKERAAAQRPSGRQDSADPSGAPAQGAVVDVSEATFEADVLQRSMRVLVVVVLGAQWSEQSAQLFQSLARLALEGNGQWVLARVDVEESPRIAQAFGVEAVPTVIALAAGQPIHAFSGPQPDEQLRRWVGELLQAVAGKLEGEAPGAEAEPPTDPRFVEAEAAVDAGDFDAAEAAYQRILDAEPRNAEAKAALAQVRFIARAQNVGPEAVAAADAAPGDLEAQLAAADFEMISGETERAFARLIRAVRNTSGDERTLVRERLLSLFELFDPADPAVLAARRNLAAALY